MNLSRVIFWDTEFENIDWEKKSRYVIERVVNYGSLSDWQAIKAYYGLDKIRVEMLLSRDLDPKSISFLSCIFNIPKEQFRCYSQILSNQPHWNY
ncbi:MAG: hypothetical protein HOD63_14065 [Bacteroidetes bacterium]|jgi:hypothetical protein|nr:hypothetical protein [Bacteroidota bacterium]MBT5530448.1 hypothetical protein [Cytophagia bacterium]MBT3424861.1 hypothetical protein [Bacteroidota bacterium]MBT3802346.1 hypothetical protein [Bacteroidota bacterium]MBT4339713.1 hypothetical protein [Bacteroidota bacterium]